VERSERRSKKSSSWRGGLGAAAANHPCHPPISMPAALLPRTFACSPRLTPSPRHDATCHESAERGAPRLAQPRDFINPGRCVAMAWIWSRIFAVQHVVTIVLQCPGRERACNGVAKRPKCRSLHAGTPHHHPTKKEEGEGEGTCPWAACPFFFLLPLGSFSAQRPEDSNAVASALSP